MAVLLFIMMLKDEGARLSEWFRHHSQYAAYNQFYIFDHGSTDPFTLELLAEAESRGTHVYRHLTDRNSFHKKGNVFADLIRTTLDPNITYDFVFPIDCDERLAMFTDTGITTDVRQIDRYAKSLRTNFSALRIPTSFFNDPGRANTYWVDKHFYKGFLRSNTIRGIDGGSHVPSSRVQQGHISTRFFYLHDHNVTDYAEWKTRGLNKLIGLAPGVDDLESAAQYAQRDSFPDQSGIHIIRDLKAYPTKEAYLNRYVDRVRVEFSLQDTNTIVLHIPTAHGVKTVLWDGERYLRDHRDVAERYTLGALQHFLTAGVDEPQRIRSVLHETV